MKRKHVYTTVKQNIIKGQVYSNYQFIVHYSLQRAFLSLLLVVF